MLPLFIHEVLWYLRLMCSLLAPSRNQRLLVATMLYQRWHLACPAASRRSTLPHIPLLARPGMKRKTVFLKMPLSSSPSLPHQPCLSPRRLPLVQHLPDPCRCRDRLPSNLEQWLVKSSNRQRQQPSLPRGSLSGPQLSNLPAVWVPRPSRPPPWRHPNSRPLLHVHPLRQRLLVACTLRRRGPWPSHPVLMLPRAHGPQRQ